jgi:protein-S-isoprenylcysteine O-methyltransferase Ste14
MPGKIAIEKYFSAEKSGSRLFMAIGIIAFIIALIFFFAMKENFYRGAAVPLAVVGLILTVVGFVVYKRSDNDRIRNVYAYDMNPGELREKELPRMRIVMRNFVILRWIEIILFLAGTGLYIYFIRDFEHDLLRGLGLGLAIMALLALLADHFAEKRGRIYTKELEDFVSASK